MPKKPTYEELELKIKALEEETNKRKQAEEALRESEDKYRALIENANEAILVAQGGVFVFSNPKGEELYGRSKEELASKHLTHFIHEEDRELVRDRHERRLKGEDLPQIYPFRIIHKKGQIKWIELSVVTFNWEKKPATLCFMADITERKRAEEDLRTSEERFRNMIEGSIQGILIHRNHKPLFVNEAWASMHGCTPEEILKMESVAPLMSPKDQARMVEYKNTRMRGEDAPRSYDYQAVRKDGSLIWLENRVTIVQWDGKPAIQTIIVDITERKRAEKKIQEQYRFLKTLFDAMPFPFYLKDINAKYLGCSPSYAEIIGVNTEEVVGKRAEDIFSDDIAAIHNQADQDLFQNPGTQVYEYRLKYADGSLHDIIVSKATYYDDNGNLTGLVGFYTDITDHKQAEEALLSEKLLAEEYINSLPGLFYVFDEQRFVRWNREWKRITGYSDEELAARYGTDFFEGKDRTLIEERMLKVFREGSSEAEAELVTKDGRRIPYYFTGLRREFNGKDHLVGLGMDITERKRLEAQLQQAHRMEAIGTLAGGIAHDFNNILSAIMGFTELAIDDVAKGTPLEDNLQEVYTAGKRARDLVKQILAFARQADQEKKPIQLDTIAVEALKLIRSTSPTTIEIKQNIKSNSLIMGNSTQIHQLFMNLCTNAVQAMEDTGGILEVGVKDAELDSKSSLTQFDLKHGTYLKVTVSDTGPGIAADIIDSIFEPYFTTKGVGKGTGMGLAMVHGIVETYGGKITVDSEVGKGTVFTIYLPITKKREAYRPYDDEKLPSGTERILFVDDELPIAKMGSQILERLGYQVTVRTSSVEALELFRSKPNDFDLVITDMTMPNMTGDELAKELIVLRSDIPVILCTGYSKKINSEMATGIGVREFAYKPLVTADLAETIRKVLDDAKGTTQE